MPKRFFVKTVAVLTGMGLSGLASVAQESSALFCYAFDSAMRRFYLG